MTLNVDLHSHSTQSDGSLTPAQLAGFKALYMDGTQFRPIDRRIQGDMVLMKLPEVDDILEIIRRMSGKQ